MENFEEKKPAGGAMNGGEEKLKQKNVDEAWKETVEKEKTQQDTSSKIEAEYPQEVNFGLFLSSLMIEGLIALGEVENPVTKKKEINLGQARYIIDVAAMIEEKTKNNLTPEEKDAIEHILYELRMRYVAKAK
jgi:hypothetical protein